MSDEDVSIFTVSAKKTAHVLVPDCPWIDMPERALESWVNSERTAQKAVD
jgi:hypothetical protein